MSTNNQNILLSCFLTLIIVLPLWSQDSLKVVASNAALGKSTLYSLEFDLPDSLQSDGAISIEFPQEYDLSSIQIAASAKIKGGFTVIVKGNEVVLVRSGLGAPLRAGEAVDLNLAAVKNPTSSSLRYSFKVYVHRESGVAIQRQMENNNYTLNASLRNLNGSITLTPEN